jgi:aldehyde dehydrogenase (NAD+)
VKTLNHFKISPENINYCSVGGVKLSQEYNTITSYNPYTQTELATVAVTTPSEVNDLIAKSLKSFHSWREIPAPKRGLLIKALGRLLNDNKSELAELISLETGKIIQESLGEVQEAIDICDFAVGLSRQLYGYTMHSERPKHRMFEQWHPLGPIGVITAFNFPIAVWAWNAAIAVICGDTVIWKPSERSPLCALAIHKLCLEVENEFETSGIFNLCFGGKSLGSILAKDDRLPLISATGSTEMGREVNIEVANRFGRALLELGGNNAVIIDKSANLDLAIKAVFFGAVGTAGQRCTTTRRLLVHKAVSDEIISRLKAAYEQITFGDPLDKATLVGPLIDFEAVLKAEQAITNCINEGGELIIGGERIFENSCFLSPTILKVKEQTPTVKQETFAPILYIIEFSNLDEAFKLHNSVPQGLSSAIYTDSLQNSEKFLAASGSDCGIANVNIGTSGAEIGGAFGGEKTTGGGREAGSDCWKFYMRRQTNTVNWSNELPLAQGITFGEYS